MVISSIGEDDQHVPSNISGDAGQDYFADGLTEEFITALAKYRWFFVIARNSSFNYKGRSLPVQQVGRELGVRYLLEGSARRSGDKVRVTVQLVDAETGRQLWSERYDRALADLFAVQDEVVGRVVGAIEPEMLKVETQLARQKTAASINAWDLTLRGMWHFNNVTKDGHLQARELFRNAIETAPELAEGHAWLGRCNAGLIFYGWSDNVAADTAEGWKAALQAARLAESDPYAHYAVGIMSIIMGQPGRAMMAAQKSIDLSPNFAPGYLQLGWSRLLAGRPTQAIEPLQQSLRLNPYDPRAYMGLQFLAISHFLLGQFEETIHCATEATGKRQDSFIAHAMLASSFTELGRHEEAQKALALLERTIPPGPSALEAIFSHIVNRAASEKLLAGLRQAGWQG